jgi:hypothetical protein
MFLGLGELPTTLLGIGIAKMRWQFKGNRIRVRFLD